MIQLRTLLMTLLFAAPCFGHAFNQSYIYLRIFDDRIEGKIEINFSDLNRALGTNFSIGSEPKAEAIEAELRRIRAYLFGRVSFKIGGEPVALEQGGYRTYTSAGYSFISCEFEMRDVTEIPDQIEVTHNLMFDKDEDHRGFVVLEHFFRQGKIENEGMVSLTFSPGDTTQTLDLTDSSVWQGVKSLTKLGVHHIWEGIDHILFLVALLLPSVLRRDEKHWEARDKFKSSLWEVFKIVTVFTIAHSITLSLAALQIVTLPSRLVESIIALSIAVAALDVLIPIFHNRILLVVLGFGLFHGFGFASVLGEMGITGSNLAWSLLGFNVGVELGQIAIVLLVFPCLFMMRLSLLYTRFSVQAGAVLCIFISLYWFIERGFDVDLTLGEFLGPILSFL